ncbi:MAG: S-layer homology domain-containing protein [bacterium]|nr:S-layer homology domain-containing protein [bacterium]
MRTKHSVKSLLSGLLAAVMTIGALPAVSVSAAQVNEYIDPADVWITSNGRTNELDFNATITQETAWCPVCNKDTINLTYRTPEYTKSGTTALNRGVQYSDGTMTDGVTKGNIDDGRPGVDATYSTYHWTKSVCQICGTINSVDGEGAYSFGKNVYGLNSCDHDFFLDFDNTTYTPYDDDYHTTVLKKGQYCQFCKGTKARATEKKEAHNFDETIISELGNQRFHLTGECEDCGYKKNEYAAAKSVIQSYYGKVDGKAHTVTVSDLSEDGVHTKIRYGTEAGKCNLTSAPNYTEEGYYPVYYEIDYSYEGESMTENGVSYVWLLADNSDNVTTNSVHTHDYRYLETVCPTCTELGYDRFQCSECGALQKTNYTPANGHDYSTIVIREASCQQGGLELHSCKNCGSYYTENTSMTDHKYQTAVIPATCTMNGYTEHKCIDCGYKYITDLTPLAKHDYREKVTARTCTTRGFTTYSCANCDDIYISDYTEPTGHEWDNGHTVTNSTCESEGVKEYNCKHCDEKMIQAISATGHTPGAAATCTEPQTCETCGAVLELPTGHHYSEAVTMPTCTAMGYTTFTCNDCGSSYVGNHTDKIEHHYHSVITPETCTELGFTTYTCTECGDEYKSDYVDKKAHAYQSAVTPPTCTTMGFTTYTCSDCGDSYVADYTDVLPHNYTKEVIEPTCTEQGYTVYTCPDCDKEFIGDEKESIEHHYNSVVTSPTCTEMGYTTYICEDCGYSYVTDYTNPTGHSYDEVVTAPTCTEIGFSTFTCKDCGNSYIGNETAKLPHNYDKAVTVPTCEEMGYTVFTCKDCGETYTGDYVDAAGHSYKEVVTAPTCMELGYSTFTCEICGHSYKGNETAKAEHQYNSVVTAPTCTELGFTTITCENCGETHKIDFVEATGHKPSDWIVDAAATIENSGSKHRECTVCGETLETVEIPQLTDKDNSDEDGHSTVGDYSILITDKDSKPIFDSEISIDNNDNITIKLPDSRLLSAEDITTITVTRSETQQPAEGINIFIADTCDNAATGKTDANGQLSVPNKQSSTSDSNGTVADSNNTYVVVVTDKNSVLIPNCTITVGDNYSINVKLPDGTAFDKDNRITVTVVTEKGEPVNSLRVQLIGDSDYIENGYTNIKGQITLPMSNTDITDDKGNGEVADKDGDKVYDYIVTVSDETGLIKDALITLIAKDNSVLVCLPEGKVIDYFNRTTVKVIRADGTPVEGWKVSVYNKDGSGLRTEVTDENGIVIVPPLSEAPISKPTPTPDPDADATPLPGVDTTPKPDNTDKPIETETPSDKPTETDKPSETGKPSETEKPSEPTPTPDLGDGSVVQNKNYKYRVYVWDNDGVITDFGLIKLQDNGSLEIELPTSKMLNPENKVNIRVINENDGSPVKGITVNVTDTAKNTASDITNSNGIAVVPVSDSDITDANGNAQVKDDEGNLYNINVATETKGNIEGAVVQIKDGKITVTLPDGTVIDYADRTTVTVTDRDNKPVSAMPVNVKDNKGGNRTEITDETGKVVVPPFSEAYTDKDGNAIINGYTVVVEDTKAKIENAYVAIKDDKISVKLPDTNELTTSNQTTVTVTDKDTKPVKDMSVTVTDKNSKTATKTTDANGKITVPVKSSGGSSGGGSHGGGGGGSSIVSNSYNVKVVDKDGKTVNVSKSVKDDKITLTLPSGTVLDGGNYYTITVTDRNGKVQPDIDVTMKDKKDNSANGTTDKNGQLVLPATEHKLYVVGYEDGTFKPEGNMTRAEAAAIFARNIAERKGENITNSKSLFTDVDAKLWYNQYISYLEKYDIIEGYDDGTFKPDEHITRAEFVTMCSRFYNLFDKTTESKNNKFTDVASSHWAYKFINSATAMDWIKGYADGTFKPDNNITRAEVVSIVNRVTDREADTEYVNKNLSNLNRFSDLTDKGYWAWTAIIEAANTHMAVTNAGGETWVK